MLNKEVIILLKRIFSLLLVLLLLAGCSKTQNSIDISLFFLKADGSDVCEEVRTVEADDDLSGKQLLDLTVTELLKGPSSSATMKSVIPQNTELLSSYINGTVAYLNFSEHFNDGKDSDRLLRRYTLICTICKMEGIKKVKISVNGQDITDADGQPLPALGVEDFLSLKPEDSQTKNMSVKLYFADAQAKPVVEETAVEIKENETIEQVIVNKLIEGPVREDIYPTVSQGTKLIDINVKEGVCFVNLSSSFVSENSASSLQATIAVYSIVNSLCELDYIDKVQFLIEGASKEYFGDLEFNEPFIPRQNW